MPYKDPEKRKEYDRNYQVGWKKRNRNKVNLYCKKYRDKTKKMVMEHYGGIPPKCACCGETIYEFLCIDHINGGGLKHRREIGGAHLMYPWLKVNNFPKGFQVLCYNCNCAKQFSKGCPHQSIRDSSTVLTKN